MEDELVSALNEHFVVLLHVELGAEGYSRKGLSLTTGEDCTSVCAWQIAYFAPDRAHLSGVTSVEADSLIENHVPHCCFLDCMIVSFNHHLLVLALLLRNGLVELLLESIESIGPFMFTLTGLCNGIAPVIAELLNGLAEIFVVLFVAVSPLHGLSDFFCELHLHLAVLLNLFVSKLDCLKHIVLADFVHLTLNHHDVVICCCDHDVNVSFLYFAEIRVNLELAVNSCHPYL